MPEKSNLEKQTIFNFSFTNTLRGNVYMYVVYKLIKPIYLYIQSYKFKQHMNQRERKT